MTDIDRPELWAPFRLAPSSWDPAGARTGAPPPAAVLESAAALARAAAHPKAAELLGRLREGAIPVVTAHQPCLFGGPMYVLVKALAAWGEAERIRRDRGVDAVPLFWVGSDDHDRDEVAGVDVVHGGDRRPTRHTAADDFPELVPVGPEPPGPACRRVWSSLARAFEAPRAAALLDALRQTALFEGPSDGEGSSSVAAGATPTMTLGFVRWLVRLLGPRAPLFLDAASPPLRELGQELLAPILGDPETFLRAGRERAAALVAAGLPAPVPVDDDALPAFLHDAAGRRRRLLWKGEDRFGLRGEDDAELRPAEILRVGPGRLSPNVLLRPLVQERALGPGVSILGPTEHAYHAQSAAWYAPLLGPSGGTGPDPLHPNPTAPGSVLLRRPSVTVCTARDAERLTGAGLDPRLVAVQGLDAVTTSSPPSTGDGHARPSAGQTMGSGAGGGRDGGDRDPADPAREAAAELEAALDRYLARMTADAPGELRSAADKLRSKVARALEGFAGRRARAMAAAREARLGALSATVERLRPGGLPQDRTVSGLSLLLRFGEPLIDALGERLLAEPGPGHHHLLVVPS